MYVLFLSDHLASILHSLVVEVMKVILISHIVLWYFRQDIESY